MKSEVCSGYKLLFFYVPLALVFGLPSGLPYLSTTVKLDLDRMIHQEQVTLFQTQINPTQINPTTLAIVDHLWPNNYLDPIVEKLQVSS